MVIANFWLLLSPAARIALSGVAQIGLVQETAGPQPKPPTVNSLTFPDLNLLSPATLKLVRNFPERFSTAMPPGLWNCYVRGAGSFEFVDIREELQELRVKYPADIIPAGCWNVSTGEPIGGVGSPWFQTPPELVAVMPPLPGVQTEPIGPPPPAPVPTVTGVLHDIVLMAGQAPRKFV